MAASASWAALSYQQLVFPTENLDSNNFLEAYAFLTNKEKKMARKSQEKPPYNRLHNYPIKSYSEWNNAKSCIREKNKAKSIARKKKKTVINLGTS